MLDIWKVFRLNKVIKAWVDEEQAKGHELEDILAALQKAVEDPDKYELEIRCWAAAGAVMVVDMINQERAADGCDA